MQNSPRGKGNSRLSNASKKVRRGPEERRVEPKGHKTVKRTALDLPDASRDKAGSRNSDGRYGNASVVESLGSATI